ncbi:MAG: hypothetical protein K6E21_02065 [Bacilli bacterium]|nr:hypothetical protein [Bacilli bacterium]
MSKNKLCLAIVVIGTGLCSNTSSIQSEELSPSLNETIDDYCNDIDYEDFNDGVVNNDFETDECVDLIVNEVDELQETLSNLEDILELALENNNETKKVIDFVKENKDSSYFNGVIEKLFSCDKYEKQLFFLENVISSDIDIFVPWYKNALLIACNSDDSDVSFFANDVLDFYKDNFKTV